MLALCYQVGGSQPRWMVLSVSQPKRSPCQSVLMRLVQTRQSLEHSPHLQTNHESSADLSAHSPPDPHWLFSSFLVKGLFLPSASGPFSLIDVRSLYAPCLVFSFLSLEVILISCHCFCTKGQVYPHSHG